MASSVIGVLVHGRGGYDLVTSLPGAAILYETLKLSHV